MHCPHPPYCAAALKERGNLERKERREAVSTNKRDGSREKAIFELEEKIRESRARKNGKEKMVL